jgi:hypothetical protein
MMTKRKFMKKDKKNPSYQMKSGKPLFLVETSVLNSSANEKKGA